MQTQDEQVVNETHMCTSVSISIGECTIHLLHPNLTYAKQQEIGSGQGRVYSVNAGESVRAWLEGAS